MDIRTLASKFYATGPELASGAVQERQETLSQDEFVELMAQAHQRRADRTENSQEPLYAGSAQRRGLSDAEIAALANRYDPHDMDQEEYGSFLDDLVDMGVISKYEKRLMGYNGTMELGYVHADGLLNDVSGILQRMEALQKAPSGEDRERAELIRQLADPDSDFYAGILQTLQRKMEEREDQEREQAIIDALGGILDAMSGKRDAKQSDIPLSMSEITRRISELDPQDPERIRLELFLDRLNEVGIYFSPSDLAGEEEERDEFETLTQFLLRRQTGRANQRETI